MNDPAPELQLVSRLSLARHRVAMRSGGHERHVAIVLTAGTALFECEGRMEVTAPSLYFVPARTPHRLLDGSGVAGWGFSGLTLPPEQRPARLAVPLSASGAGQLDTWFTGIERESAEGRPYRDAAIDALRVLANVEIARVASRSGAFEARRRGGGLCLGHWVSFVAVAVFQPRPVRSGSWLADLLLSAFATIGLATITSGIIFRVFLAAMAVRREREAQQAAAKPA